jgi:hypothetical protein
MILVSGCEYSGTSLTAGLLHHLGVCMGEIETPQDLWFTQQTWDSLQVGDPGRSGGEPRGYLSYQCKTFDQLAEPYILEAHAGNYYQAEALGELVVHYGRMRTGVWGVKHTALVFLTWYSGLGKLPAKWILTSRDLDHQARSCQRYTGDATVPALWAHSIFGVQRLAYLRLRQQLGDSPQLLVVDYELTRRFPQRTITQLIDYLQINPTAAQVAAALDSVRKD